MTRCPFWNKAYAKLNLSLDVLDRRSDGYHEMRMVMQTVTLSDALRLETGTGKPLSMRSSLGFLPADERNWRRPPALRLCAETGADCGGLSIGAGQVHPGVRRAGGGQRRRRCRPAGAQPPAGLGLPPERLEAIGARVGSDVPYCVRGGTALAEGRGEVLTTLPALPDCHVVLCKPAFSVPTPELFARLDGCRIRRRPDTAGLLAALAAGDLAGVARRMYNVFEDVLPERRGAEVQRIKNALVQQGALGASMSGTGSTVFGLFDREEAARRAYELLQESYRDTFLARSLEKNGIETGITVHNVGTT